MASNIFGLLKILNPSASKDIVTVLASNADGTAEVETLSGNSYVARGSGEVGGKVYIQGGIIQSEAPDLPYSTIFI